MSAKEKVIDDLNVAKLMLCSPQMLNPEMCVKIGQAINNAIDLLAEQKSEKVLSMKHDPVFIDYLTGNCPGCHKHIEQITNRHYCGYCGKGLKWE